MQKLSDQQINTIAQTLIAENGGELADFQPLLKRTLTVGALKKALEGVDESLPVEVEVVLQLTEEGDCMTQPGLVIHAYTVKEGEQGFARFSLVGAQPENAESYAEAFELDSENSNLN